MCLTLKVRYNIFLKDSFFFFFRTNKENYFFTRENRLCFVQRNTTIFTVLIINHFKKSKREKIKINIYKDCYLGLTHVCKNK